MVSIRDDRRDDKTRRRQQCPTPRVCDLAEPRDAQYVTASLVSSGTTRGECPSVPRSASIASELAERVTAIGCPGCKSPRRRRQRTAVAWYVLTVPRSRRRRREGSRSAGSRLTVGARRASSFMGASEARLKEVLQCLSCLESDSITSRWSPAVEARPCWDCERINRGVLHFGSR